MLCLCGPLQQNEITPHSGGDGISVQVYGPVIHNVKTV